jgi:hypothetical protein
MPALTRRRDPDDHQETWGIHCGDVQAGTIALRSGNPSATDRWQWYCGFYRGSDPGECTSGTAASFWEARTAFEAAWRIFLAKRTDADFQAWRDQRDRTARKYALWDAGERLPTPEWEPGRPCSIWMKCRCGETFDSHRLEHTVIHVPHITAEHQSLYREVTRYGNETRISVH